MRLEWKKLFSVERMRQSGRQNTEIRNQFEADYDRIVGSSSVRRLQDKAQVFPLQPDDVVRTRLTHSMEVSALAASLGKRIGTRLYKIKEFQLEDIDKLSSLLRVSGLIHDIGNPPFGHYGETVIQDWFKKSLNGEGENTQEFMDFARFDGNVQNLRVVSRLQTLNDEYGANFTFATLATIVKYPYNSIALDNPKGKFGYFKSEKNIIDRIRECTGLNEGIRHPATYILEAADDIVYLCDDIEDGVKKGLIPWKAVYDEIRQALDNKYSDLFNIIDEKNVNDSFDEEEQALTHVRFFRNYTQSRLMDIAENAFIDNYDSIMEGRYRFNELLSPAGDLVGELKNITRKFCFSSDEVLSLELVGKRVLNQLLDEFSSLIDAEKEQLIDSRKAEGKLYCLISSNYKFINKIELEKYSAGIEDAEKYFRRHLIVDFISGMTDSYAVRVYKRLMGISVLG